MSRDPFCGNCGYTLKGLTESSKCPECGKPLVDVLERPSNVSRGKRYTSDIVIFGLPLIQIALGPYEDEKIGHARAVIAVGDRATGWLAIGGFTRGLISIGGTAIGVVAFGGLSAGVIGVGGAAVGLLAAMGGISAGGAAMGGLAVALIAVSGGLALAVYARGGQAIAAHGMGGFGTDQIAVDFFNDYSWLFGLSPSGAKFAAWVGLAIFLWAVLLFLVALAGYLTQSRPASRDHSQMR